MRVWIDQRYCTGDNLGEEICPVVFTQLDDGVSYVKRDDRALSDPGGRACMVAVPAELEAAVRDAADQSAGECLFVEE
jgi:ferredoxin